MTASEVVLRGYRPEDAKALAALDDLCFDARFRFSLRAMKRFAGASNAIVRIAERNGILAGFVIAHLEQDGAYLVTLDVAPEYRRRGVAASLVRAAQVEAAHSGVSALFLHVFTGNTAAIAFYEGLGYERTNTVSGFYGDGLDAFVYRFELSAHQR